jgi:hypothetical protein
MPVRSSSLRHEDRSLVGGLVGDGRPLLLAAGASLMFAGGFATYLAVTRQLLPHDLAYIGMTAADLDRVAAGRLVDFMVHDRVAWGSTLMAIGLLYLWLVAFPLSAGRRWAWHTLAASGLVGFLSFASYLGTGYLDSWHGLGTALLLPTFVAGLARSRRLVAPTRAVGAPGVRALGWSWPRGNPGRSLLMATGGGLVLGGSAILAIGLTSTFVPSDLRFMATSPQTLDRVTPRLIPLIAHDRVGFAGCVIVGGLLVAAVAAWGEGRAAVQAVGTAGALAFAPTIAIHLAVGYDDPLHLAPAVAGAMALAVGTLGWWRSEFAGERTARDGVGNAVPGTASRVDG